MLDRTYFEHVLPEQIALMEKPVRLTLYLASGSEYQVHSLVAAHDTYVVLAVYGNAKAPTHTKPWQEAHGGQDASIYDQVCLPYAVIAHSHLTARATKGDDARQVIGFGQS